jgi:hypothetical protein
MEEKLSDVSATLAEEEEKAKHLLKLKAKHESTIGMRGPCPLTFSCNIHISGGLVKIFWVKNSSFFFQLAEIQRNVMKYVP